MRHLVIGGEGAAGQDVGRKAERLLEEHAPPVISSKTCSEARRLGANREKASRPPRRFAEYGPIQ
jgi:siroheme synthase (precorrin-2 oxidase/ferrochelatase)